MPLFRAIDTVRPAHKRLFTDPYASIFPDRGLKRAAKISRYPVVGAIGLTEAFDMARIEYAKISDAEKKLVMGENAQKLLDSLRK